MTTVHPFSTKAAGLSLQWPAPLAASGSIYFHRFRHPEGACREQPSVGRQQNMHAEKNEEPGMTLLEMSRAIRVHHPSGFARLVLWHTAPSPKDVPRALRSMSARYVAINRSDRGEKALRKAGHAHRAFHAQSFMARTRPRILPCRSTGSSTTRPVSGST